MQSHLLIIHSWFGEGKNPDDVSVLSIVGYASTYSEMAPFTGTRFLLIPVYIYAVNDSSK